MPIRIIPVVDLRGGRAVHAQGGDRETYGPLESILIRGSDPCELVLAYRDVLGLDEFYLADLDAIGGGHSDNRFVRTACDAGLTCWVDVGLKDDRPIDDLFAAGASTVIAATETLTGPAALRRIVERSKAGSVVFGLDLRNGVPLLATGSRWKTDRPESLIEEAIAMEVRRVLILDIGRVGSARGVGSLAIARDLTRRWPGVEVSVGGGVGNIDDLRTLEAVGVSNVLIGSALHNGTIRVEHLRALRSGGVKS